MTLRRVLGLAASRPWWLLFGGAVAAAAVIANVALVGMSAYLISRAQTASNVADLALAITAVRVLAIGRAVARYVERIVVHAGTFRVLADLRSWFFASIEPLAPARLRAVRSGDLLARITADVGTLEEAFAGVAVPPVAAAAALAFGAVLLGAIASAAGLLLLGFALFAGLAVPSVVRRLSRRPAQARIADRSLATALALDGVRGVADLGGTGSGGGPPLRLPQGVWCDGRRDGPVDDDPGGRDRRRVGAGRRMRGRRALGGHRRRARGRRSTSAAGRTPARGDRGVRGGRARLAASVQRLDVMEAAGARLFELMDVPPAVADPVSPAAPPSTGPVGLDVRHLRFAYDAGGRDVIHDVSFSIAPGGRLAIVGPSGAGKSTLVQLLLRFEAYAAGEIRLGGREVRELAADDVRTMLAVALQRVDLFDASIRDNLALADADLTDERARAALEAAQLGSFVDSPPRW